MPRIYLRFVDRVVVGEAARHEVVEAQADAVVLGNLIHIEIKLGVARNPASRDRVFGLAILGFALTEAVALYALVIAFIILFV